MRSLSNVLGVLVVVTLGHAFAGANSAAATWRGYNGSVCVSMTEAEDLTAYASGAVARDSDAGTNTIFVTCPMDVVSSAASTSSFEANVYVVDNSGTYNFSCYWTGRAFTDVDGTYYTSSSVSSTGASASLQTLHFSSITNGSYWLHSLNCFEIGSGMSIESFWVDEP